MVHFGVRSSVVGDLAFHGWDNAWCDQERLCRVAHCRALSVVIGTHASYAEERHRHDSEYYSAGADMGHLSPRNEVVVTGQGLKVQDSHYDRVWYFKQGSRAYP